MLQEKIRITLKSDTHIGSGEGFGTIIDSDVVFDTIGIPYIPAKRIKGCLRDSTIELNGMLSHTDSIPLFLEWEKINECFGKPGAEQSSPVFFHDFHIPEYDLNVKYLRNFLKNSFESIMTKETIRNYFTSLRKQTAINCETGCTEQNSLRVIRVLDKNLVFEGTVGFADEQYIDLIALACANLNNIGTSRNRGVGEITCELLDCSTNSDNLTCNAMRKLEEKCLS